MWTWRKTAQTFLTVILRLFLIPITILTNTLPGFIKDGTLSIPDIGWFILIVGIIASILVYAVEYFINPNKSKNTHLNEYVKEEITPLLGSLSGLIAQKLNLQFLESGGDAKKVLFPTNIIVTLYKREGLLGRQLRPFSCSFEDHKNVPYSIREGLQGYILRQKVDYAIDWTKPYQKQDNQEKFKEIIQNMKPSQFKYLKNNDIDYSYAIPICVPDSSDYYGNSDRITGVLVIDFKKSEQIINIENLTQTPYGRILANEIFEISYAIEQCLSKH